MSKSSINRTYDDVNKNSYKSLLIMNKNKANNVNNVFCKYNELVE